MILPQNAPVKGYDRICPNSCDSENPLKKYLILTQKFPQGSREQQKAFERLCYHLKPHLRCKNSQYVSEHDHEEAVNDTILVVYKYLNRLTPNHIVPFAKNVLSKKLVNQIRQEKRKKRPVSLDQSMSEDGQTAFIEMIAPEPDPTSEEYDRVKNMVKNDPDNMLQKSMRGRSDITWQKILQYRLQGYQWNELEHIFGKSVSSLNSFDKREITRLTPYLREALSS